MMTNCPTCGSPVTIVTTNEGTSYYEPALGAEVARLRKEIATADELVSKAHDIVWASYAEWEGDSGRREPLNAALWRLHEHLRPLLLDDSGADSPRETTPLKDLDAPRRGFV